MKLGTSPNPANPRITRDFTRHIKEPRETVRVLLAIDVREFKPVILELRNLSRPLQSKFVRLNRAPQRTRCKALKTAEKKAVCAYERPHLTDR